MSPHIDRPVPPYLQILRAIRAQIAEGALRPGEAVPSERKIVADWGVSRATATKVLAALRAEDLVESIQGVGTVVREQSTAGHSAFDRVVSIRRTGRIYPSNEHARIVVAELIDAPEPVAAALGLEQGAQAIRRQRITFRDDTPVSASTSWFAGDLAQTSPKLLLTERLTEGTPAYIEATTGRKFAAGRNQHSAKSATPEDAENLQVPVGAPVLAGRNWIYDVEGDVVEYGESITIEERWTSYDFSVPA